MATLRGVDCAIGGACGASSALLSRFSAYAVKTTSPSAPTAKKILCFSAEFKIRGAIFVKARSRLTIKYSCKDEIRRGGETRTDISSDIVESFKMNMSKRRYMSPNTIECSMGSMCIFVDYDLSTQ